MASIPPPQGLDENDYEAIEAAVTETVRGRWFLAEFARRNRSAEMRQILDAMARLETVVASSQAQLPSADPSIRLLIQRIKDVSGQLESLGRDMREGEVDERYVAALESQAKAVAGLMRAGAIGGPLSPPRTEKVGAPAPTQQLSRPEPGSPAPARRSSPRDGGESDPRRAALSGFDSLPLREKLAIFT